MARIHSSIAIAGLWLVSAFACAANLQVQVLDPAGRPVKDAVVTLQGPLGQPAGLLKADMDQRDKEFAPHVLAIHTGTPVKFPNSDNIRHQVYSFSPTKRFELRLYEGTPSDPVLFEKPGVVVLGCNIHDWMLGYIYVTDDPRFGVTDAQGKLTLEQLPAGSYQATLWHPQVRDLQPQAGGSVPIPAQGAQQTFQLTLEPLSADMPTPPAPSAFGDAFKRAASETAQ